MNLQRYRAVFMAVTGVLALLMVLPVLQRALVYPQTEFFTEAWILGPERKTEGYPFNVTAGNSSNVFLGLCNHLGNFSYYQVQVKLRSQNQSTPDSFNWTFSNQPALYNIYALVADNETWEMPLSFSFNYVFDESGSGAILGSMVFNGNTVDLSGYSALVDAKEQCLVNLFFEVWIYDDAQGVFRYHERVVGLWLNLQ